MANPAAAFARMMSYIVDNSRAGHNLAGVGIEVSIGLAILAAQL